MALAALTGEAALADDKLGGAGLPSGGGGGGGGGGLFSHGSSRAPRVVFQMPDEVRGPHHHGSLPSRAMTP
jgi:hypothetical protein